MNLSRIGTQLSLLENSKQELRYVSAKQEISFPDVFDGPRSLSTESESLSGNDIIYANIDGTKDSSTECVYETISDTISDTQDKVFTPTEQILKI